MNDEVSAKPRPPANTLVLNGLGRRVLARAFAEKKEKDLQVAGIVTGVFAALGIDPDRFLGIEEQGDDLVLLYAPLEKGE